MVTFLNIIRLRLLEAPNSPVHIQVKHYAMKAYGGVEV
jgi:hypothetical protein